MTALCVVCGRGCVDRGQVCDSDRDALSTLLTTDIPAEYAALEASLQPGRAGSQRVSGTRTPPLPASLPALNLRGPGAAAHLEPPNQPHAADQIGEPPLLWLLDQWVRDWAERRGDLRRPVPTVDALCGWLDIRLQWACDHHPAMADFAHELRSAHAAMRAANGERSDWHKIGRCPELLDDGTVCGTELRHNPDPKTNKKHPDVIICRGCGTQWGRQHWLWLGQVIRDTADERMAP